MEKYAETMFFDILSVHIVLFLFFIFYLAVLKGCSEPSLNRIFLLSLPLAAITFPVLSHSISALFPFKEQLSSVIPLVQGPTVRIGRGTVSGGGGVPMLSTLIVGVYILGVLLKLVFFFQKIRSLFKLQKGAEKEKAFGLPYLRLEKEHAPFTFLGRIHLGRNIRPTACLLEHEWVHVREWHSLDLLYIELLHTILWYDPVMPFLKRCLRTEHEVQADREVVGSGYDREAYAEYLLEVSGGQLPSGPLNSFAHVSHLKNRITMIYRKTDRSKSIIRCLMALPLFLLLLLSHSAIGQDQKDSGSSEDKQGKVEPVKNPDIDPSFGSSKAALREYLAQELNYPEKAKSDSIEGTVHVGFVIGKDGKVQQVESKTEPHPLLVEEAERVIGSMPDWEAGEKDGKKVPVQVVVPVQFKL